MKIEHEISSGNFNTPKPRKALNKAFLKIKTNRSQIELFKAKENFGADTSSQEAEIDWLVYQFYGLTDEEIQIIEPQKLIMINVIKQ